MDKKKIIYDEIVYLDNEELVNIVNDYLNEIGKNNLYVKQNNRNNVCDIFDDSLYVYFDNLDRADNFDLKDDFIYLSEQGTIETTDDIFDVVSRDEIARYVVDFFDDYDYLFDDYIFIEE